MKNLGVIVPFYNEELFLSESVDRLIKQKIFHQIVLVDDCSTDSSLDIARNLSKNFDNISTVSTGRNSGKGAAVIKGLEYIDSTHVIIHDADLEYFPEDIPEMFAQASLNSNSLILGSRTIGDKKRSSIYKRTYFVQKAFSLLFRALNGKFVSDIASCYWLIETETLRDLNLVEKGFSIEIEVLSKVINRGMNIVEIPIRYDARSYEEGKKIKTSDAIQILFKIVLFSKLFAFFDKNQIE